MQYNLTKSSVCFSVTTIIINMTLWADELGFNPYRMVGKF